MGSAASVEKVQNPTQSIPSNTVLPYHQQGGYPNNPIQVTPFYVTNPSTNQIPENGIEGYSPQPIPLRYPSMYKDNYYQGQQTISNFAPSTFSQTPNVTDNQRLMGDSINPEANNDEVVSNSYELLQKANYQNYQQPQLTIFPDIRTINSQSESLKPVMKTIPTTLQYERDNKIQLLSPYSNITPKYEQINYSNNSFNPEINNGSNINDQMINNSIQNSQMFANSLAHNTNLPNAGKLAYNNFNYHNMNMNLNTHPVNVNMDVNNNNSNMILNPANNLMNNSNLNNNLNNNNMNNLNNLNNINNSCTINNNRINLQPNMNYPHPNMIHISNDHLNLPVVKDEKKETNNNNNIADLKDHIPNDRKRKLDSSKDGNKLEDGYKWRKYGRKKVKGTLHPRSYYKCRNPNCPAKKITETITRDDGTIEIRTSYKDSHSHWPFKVTRLFVSNQTDFKNFVISHVCFFFIFYFLNF